MIPQMNVVTAAHHCCRIPRALRASRPFDRREVGLLRLYRARLPRPHPGRACRVACSRARAAAPSAGVYQTVKRSARACPLLTYLLLPFRDLKLSHLAERAKRTPKGSLFATRANRRAFQRQRGRVDWRRWGIMKRGRRTGRH